MSSKRGFVGTIILIIIALALLKYFLNWDVLDASQTSQGQTTIAYVKNVVNLVWGYISTPVLFVWQRIVEPIAMLGWNSLQQLIDNGGISFPASPLAP